jgi:NADH dehydrogenase
MPARKPIDKLITIYGGSGFVGRHLVRALARRGYRIRNAVRRPDLAGHLQPLGRVGQIHSVQANLRDRASVERAALGADMLINLVGILFERGKQRFDAVHAQGAELVAQAARNAGVPLVHVSAIGADANSTSAYARTKADADARVLSTLPSAIVMRPSVQFGPEDNFTNLFASLSTLSPFLPLVGGGETKFQPVFVGDVAKAIAKAVDGEARPGAIYELGGPEVMTFKEILEQLLKTIGRKRILLPLPFGIAKLQAAFLQYLPTPLLTPDQVELLRTDNVVSAAARAEGRTIEALGIDPETMEAITPAYLWRFRKTGQFHTQPTGETA